MSERTFEAFIKLVQDSCEGQAKRKGYAEAGADGNNPLIDFKTSIGIEPHHSIGEIIMKCVEYIKEPRESCIIKIAAWAFLVWKNEPNIKRGNKG